MLLTGALAVGAAAAVDRAERGAGTAVSLRAAIQNAIAEENAALRAKTPAAAKARVAKAIAQLDQAQELFESAEGRILPKADALGQTLRAASGLDAIAATRFERAQKQKDKKKRAALMKSARSSLRAALGPKGAALNSVPSEASHGCRVVSKSIGTSSFVLVDRCTTAVDLVNLTAEKGDPLTNLPADVESGATSTKVACNLKKTVLSCPVKLDGTGALILNTTTIKNETTIALLLSAASGVQYGKALISQNP